MIYSLLPPMMMSEFTKILTWLRFTPSEDLASINSARCKTAFNYSLRVLMNMSEYYYKKNCTLLFVLLFTFSQVLITGLWC